MKRQWYLARLSRMTPREVAGRLQVLAWQRWWRRAQRQPDGMAHLRPDRRLGPRRAAVALPRMRGPDHPEIVAAADRLLAGQWPIFHLRDAAVGTVPDWFRDPASQRRSDPATFAFAVRYRDEAAVGNCKYVWEMSRHQATTVLAAAWWLTGDDRYAERVRAHLQSWWAENPFMRGINWNSGIEAGLRLLSWTWIRALLSDWPGVGSLFDENEAFIRQLYHHQVYLRRLRSRGSSANNHLIAEYAGLAAASAAFPWFDDSAAWSDWAREGLEAQAEAQTHPDGFNREQASEYHVFVGEMLAAAALAVRLAGQAALGPVEAAVRRMADALAASLDTEGHMPRFGDGDEGRGVLLDAPETPAAAIFLDSAAAVAGPAAWWPPRRATLLGAIARQLCGEPPARAVPRPSHFPDCGMTLLRVGEGREEVWLRCDAGPHGFLSIAAHGHADALSIELRRGGTEIFADPGTYCYHGEPEWRSYFRGTPGHNTLTIEGQDQARAAGPFLWLDRPGAVLAERVTDGPILSWTASHDGYRRLLDPATHHRHAALHRASGEVEIEDWIECETPHDVALAFHLGPEVEAALDGATARLRWPGGSATLVLPPGLEWRTARGETDRPLGWYSPGFGRRIPSTTLVGTGTLAPAVRLLTTLRFTSGERLLSCELETAAS